MATQQGIPNQLAWAAPYVGRVRLARIAILIVGLSVSLGVVFSNVTQDVLDRPFIAGVVLFTVATALTWAPGFKQLRPWILCVVPLLDIATIGVFDLIPGADVVDGLITLPAMWLGATLGWRGTALTTSAVGLFAFVPGLATLGVPLEGSSQAASITMLAGLSAAGMTLSNRVWMQQLHRLQKQGEALESAVEVKGDFIALVSHELRTPLTSIIGYLDLLDDIDEPFPEDAPQFLGAVSRNADRLLLLVTDLLAASEVENKPMRLNLEATDLGALASLSLEDARQRATDAGVQLVADLPAGLVVQADPSRVLQVLDNLLSNAVKFTPSGGLISVSLCEAGDGIDLVVTDTGIGIDAASLPHLATKFYRTRQVTNKAMPGIGLGLMIAKSIIEAHHGALTFTSQESQGTAVCVHLPAKPLDVPRSPAPMIGAGRLDAA